MAAFGAFCLSEECRKAMPDERHIRKQNKAKKEQAT
jgi:hypothetical protein